MKKLIATACAAIASAAALASTVESSNTFGVLKVATTGAGQYFISVPWKTVGGSADTIAPTNLVLATNLNANDRLYAYAGSGSGTQFGAWYVEDDEKSGVKSWEEDDVLDSSDEKITPPSTVARGAGILIETNADAIYLTGQYSEDNKAITITGSSDGETPAYTLIGAKLAKSYALNGQDWPGAAANDVILLNGGKTTTFNGTTWSKVGGKFTGTEPVLTAGTGAWYIRYGTGTASVTFTNEYTSVTNE